MKQQSFGHSDPGKVKKDNEDAILLAVERGLYVLCDGCGGHAAGKIAGKMTCNLTYEAIKLHAEALASCADEPTPARRAKVLDAIESGVNAASQRVWQAARSDPDKQGMATTVVVLTVTGRHALIAHAGDSRLYLLRGGKIHQLTEDHTMASRYVRMGLLTPRQAAEAPAGSRLLRAVGFHERVRLDTLHFELADGDRLLLCSDGLTGYLTGEELLALCDAGPLTRAPGRLIAEANKRGGRDNISAIVVEVSDGDAEAARDLADRLGALHAAPMFRNLGYADLLRVAGVAEQVRFAPGETIVREGEPGDRVFVSLAGAVEVRKRDQALAELPPRSPFGEMGFLDRTPRTADVVARDDVHALMIPRKALMDLLRRDRLLAIRVLWGLCRVLNERLYRTSNELGELKDVVDARGDEGQGEPVPIEDAPENENLSQE